MEECGGLPKDPLEILEDRIHTVRINLLDGLSKSSSEIVDGSVLPLEDGLQRTNISFLSNLAQVLGNECNPQFAERVDRSLWEFVEPSQGGPLQAGREHFA